MFSAVIPDDENGTSNQQNPIENEGLPHGTRHHQHPLLDPLLQLSSRLRAVAHLWPVYILDIVRDMAGKDPQRKVADFDRECMPDGVPDRSQFDVHGALEDNKVKQLEYK